MVKFGGDLVGRGLVPAEGVMTWIHTLLSEKARPISENPDAGPTFIIFWWKKKPKIDCLKRIEEWNLRYCNRWVNCSSILFLGWTLLVAHFCEGSIGIGIHQPRSGQDPTSWISTYQNIVWFQACPHGANNGRSIFFLFVPSKFTPPEGETTYIQT